MQCQFHRVNLISALTLKSYLEVWLPKHTPRLSAAAEWEGTAGEALPSSSYSTATLRLQREV